MNNPLPLVPRKPLMLLDDAVTQLLAGVTSLVACEHIDICDADGRVLAQDLVSGLQVPPHDNSAMDGYAVRCSDLAEAVALPVSQRIAAGSVGTELAPHSVARIFTGAPIPRGADAVVMQEHCTVLDDGLVRVEQVVAPGVNIRRAGEDVTLGAVVLQKGERLTPASLGLAASMGVAQVDVVRRPRVALLSTGNELVMPGTVAPEHLPPGAIYNSNRFFLKALLRRLGCEVTDLGNVPDQLDATVAALRAAALDHDVILTSGGVSVGEEDHLKPAVQALGHLDLWQIAIKPGKPFAHGRIGANGAHVIGLPGNPVASFVTFVLLVRPLLLRLQGVRDVALNSTAAKADFTWAKADKRREFLRAKRNPQGDLTLYPNQGSGVLTSVVWGDGLVDVPPGHTIAPGDTVQFIAFSEVLA